ncbi:MAG TPA: radical SAM protein [Candidatus Cloacimonetes bacterium]|nr:radical SAM protein [Candidatus Cloacimonadota bacterium]
MENTPKNFLDLHIVDFCQLDCKHCYLNKRNNAMPLNMIISVCTDFLQTKFPLQSSGIILSGGEPLLHPSFIKVCDIMRKLDGSIRMSTNGILMPAFIHIFKRRDNIQVSVDGDQKAHDFIRGKGTYEKAIVSLKLLDRYKIGHSIAFTINQANEHCIDHIIDICIETGTRTLNCNIYQPIRNNALEPIRYMEWMEIRKYLEKRAEKEGIHIPSSCIEGGCIARILGLSVLPDGTYWDCSRNQKVIGRYPQPIREVLLWDHIKEYKSVNPFDTCCRNLKW